LQRDAVSVDHSGGSRWWYRFGYPHQIGNARTGSQRIRRADGLTKLAGV
jgi:hypothetical protein